MRPDEVLSPGDIPLSDAAGRGQLASRGCWIADPYNSIVRWKSLEAKKSGWKNQGVKPV